MRSCLIYLFEARMSETNTIWSLRFREISFYQSDLNEDLMILMNKSQETTLMNKQKKFLIKEPK